MQSQGPPEWAQPDPEAFNNPFAGVGVKNDSVWQFSPEVPSQAGPSNYAGNPNFAMLYTSPQQQAYGIPQVRPGDVGAVPYPQGGRKASTNGDREEKTGQNTANRPALSSTGVSLRRGMACGFCRKRKLRCSGERPLCSNCVKFNRVCEYVNHPQRPGAGDEQGEPMSSGEPPNAHPPHESPSHNAFTSAPLPHDGQASTGMFSAALHTGTFPSFETSFEHHMAAHHFTYPPTIPDGNQPLNNTQNYPGIQPNNPYSTLLQPMHDTQPQPHQQNFEPYFDLSFPPYSTAIDPVQPQTATIYGPPPPINPISPNLPPPHQIPTSIQMGTGSIDDPSSRRESEISGNIDPYSPATSALTGRPSRIQINSINSTSGPPQRMMSGRSSLSYGDRSNRSTPDPTAPPPPSSVHDPTAPSPYLSPPPKSSAMYNNNLRIPGQIDPIEGLTERLGEFLFSPATTNTSSPPASGSGLSNAKKKSRTSISNGGGQGNKGTVWFAGKEVDGLSDTSRNALLDCFLAHSRLFFEMSVPRFRYRMTFTDRRRPSLALLNSMYLWGTRLLGDPTKAVMEHNFYDAAVRSLEAQTSSADRLIDAIRAAMLLSAYTYSSGRFHEGWLLAGVAVRIVVSTGIHQIPSCVFKPEPPRNPLLRNKVFILPPPEDALDLAERIHTFWAVMAIERCAAVATGFPPALRDEDITTPFPRPLADIASCNVTHQDDISIRSLYRHSYIDVLEDSYYVKWVKSVILMERASKLAFREPEEGSEYSNAWSQYSVALNTLNNTNTSPPPPAPWLDQPKYRCPSEYRETKLGLDLFIESMGVEGIDPVVRIRNAAIDRAAEPVIISYTISMHHHLAAISMLLHDINSMECENKEALTAARKSVALMRSLPPIPFQDVDSFAVLVWGLTVKTLIKEMHRLRMVGDGANAKIVEDEADVILAEMARIGETMALARSHHKAMLDLKNDPNPPDDRSREEDSRGH